MTPNRLLPVLSLVLLAACTSTNMTPVPLAGVTLSPTPIQTAPLPSPTAIPTLVPLTPTLTVSPTRTPSGPALAEFCRIPTATPTPKSSDILYFRVDRQGWYRTADRFASSEWVAPYGSLSRDLKYLVTFDCQGAGTICVASPPAAKPHVLPVRHDFIGGGSTFSAGWLSDNRRLVFWASVKTPAGDLDARLYLLDLSTGNLVELTTNMDYDYDVSPVGECVAYTAYKDDVSSFQFHVAALDGDRVREVWRAPVDADGKRQWPKLGESMAWSWDGRRLAFVKRLPHDIRVWDLTTGDQQVYDICAQQGRGACGADILRWSPDGTQIYLHSGVAHWMLNLATGSVRQLLDRQTYVLGRSLMYQWLPDSQSLIVAEREGSALLWLDGRGEVPLIYPGKEDRKLIDDLFW
jgi:WD40 repeat protein